MVKWQRHGEDVVFANRENKFEDGAEARRVLHEELAPARALAARLLLPPFDAGWSVVDVDTASTTPAPRPVPETIAAPELAEHTEDTAPAVRHAPPKRHR